LARQPAVDPDLNRPIRRGVGRTHELPLESWRAPRCALVIFRHVPKTGGTSVKNLFARLELGELFEAHTIERKRCHRWADDSRSACAGRALDGLALVRDFATALSEGRAPSRRVFLEIHIEDGHADVVDAILAEADAARPAARRAGCRIVTSMLVRDPFSYYASLFRYSGARECGGCTLERYVEQHPNAQAHHLLSLQSSRTGSSAQALASFDRPRRTLSRTQLELALGALSAGGSGASGGSSARAMLAQLASRFDLVAPMERFNEFAVLLCQQVGLAPCPAYWLANEGRIWAHKLQAMGAVANESDPRVLAAVREHNPIDLELYANASARFARQAAARGAVFERAVRKYATGEQLLPELRFCWRGGAAPFDPRAVLVGAPFPRLSAKRLRFGYTRWLLFRAGDVDTDGRSICKDRPQAGAGASTALARRRARTSRRASERSTSGVESPSKP
jgi:hypothetical protein